MMYIHNYNHTVSYVYIHNGFVNIKGLVIKYKGGGLEKVGEPGGRATCFHTAIKG